MNNQLFNRFKFPRLANKTKIVATLISVAFLSACGNSSDNSEHEHAHIETEGRLAVFDSDVQALKVINLADGSIMDNFVLDGAASPRLYTLPGSRYAAVVQRDDNLVSFLDSGLYTEDHGDHLHDYEENPSLLSFALTNVKPTHFEAGEDTAIIFNDGSDTSVASVSVFSGTSIANGETLFYHLNRKDKASIFSKKWQRFRSTKIGRILIPPYYFKNSKIFE